MIEILLQAERALTMGMIDQAERLYRQAATADPRNSIAVVGLARVALERGDDPAAWRHAKDALVIDPENVAASRLADRLEEVWAYRGDSLPDVAMAEATAAAGAAAPEAEPAPEPQPEPAPVVAPRHGVVDRLFRRNRP
ncbi:MAG TPA: tetratricopeptide repeat protein [Candidatus Limnocylindrales bacterium]|nr:tetratricopeptide repeat protein [Candidatus Limnocylindrales bacterium]